MATLQYAPPSPLHLPNAFLCIPPEIVTLDVRLIYKRSSITTTVITIASTMMVMTTLEAMAAVFVDACDEGKKVREQNGNSYSCMYCIIERYLACVRYMLYIVHYYQRKCKAVQDTTLIPQLLQA